MRTGIGRHKKEHTVYFLDVFVFEHKHRPHELTLDEIIAACDGAVDKVPACAGGVGGEHVRSGTPARKRTDTVAER